MKAIEILKEYKTIDFGCDMSDLYERCDEAIEELEALQNRSCGNCAFNGNVDKTSPLVFCSKHNGFVAQYQFKYCGYYESKEIKQC